jgi:hypothetical protein
MKIVGVQQKFNSDKKNIRFESLHVLHLPDEFASKPSEVIYKAAGDTTPEFRPLRALLRKFAQFINEKTNPEIHYGTVANLINGENVGVRLTDTSDFLNVYVGHNRTQSKAAFTNLCDSTDSFHYRVNSQGEFEKFDYTPTALK